MKFFPRSLLRPPQR